MNPIEFKNKWMPVELKERAIAHEHFLDLCSVVGQLTPASADPKGEFFTFERASAKQSGKRGWADVWYKGKFAWEYKSPGKDLVAAYKQLLEYRENLENPPLLIVSDIRTFEIHTNFTGTAKRTHTLLLQNFDNVDTVRVLRRVFTDPYSFEPGESAHIVTELAAQKFARIADGLRARGVNEQSAGHYLMQILFCLFAKDIGVLDRQLFENVIDFGRRLPTAFHKRLGPLFQSLRDGGEVFGLYAVPHVDGGLFNTVETYELTKTEVDLIADAAQLDWSAIDPSILGTLFERSLDPGKRAQRGLHYTSRDHVERVVLPVVMAPLREEWEELQASSLATLRADAEALANTDVVDSSGLTLEREIDAFRARLANVRILDPACGSGNFLYIALEKLLALEKEVIQFDTRPLAPSRRPMVHTGQMLGLEIEPLARELAQFSLWIGYLQWRMDNGYEWTEPILAPLETIQLQDALITETSSGPEVVGEDLRVLPQSQPDVTETPWPKADYIIGNPPFLGRQMQRRRLGDAYIETLRLTYRARLSRGCDLACYFFEQARSQIENGGAKRVGLLANTTISQIDNREVLQRIKATGDIFVAWTNVPWILDGARVRIAIVGFDDGAESSKQLDGCTVESIGADLTMVGGDTPVHRLRENLAISFQGPIKVGPFDISGDTARSWLGAPLNPHGKPNSDVVKRFVNASEITRRPHDVYHEGETLSRPKRRAKEVVIHGPTLSGGAQARGRGARGGGPQGQGRRDRARSSPAHPVELGLCRPGPAGGS